MNETIDKLKKLLENDKKTIEENYKEIERQKEIIRQLDIKNLELTTIVNEVRKLLQKANIYRNYDDDEDDTWYTDLNIDEALEILDKADKGE